MTTRVRFAWWMYGVFLGPGIGLSALGLWFWATDTGEKGSPALVFGLVLLAFGIVYACFPYFVLTPKKLSVPTLLGGSSQTAVDPRARLDADGTRLIMTVGNMMPTSLPVRRAMASRKDWDSLRELLDRQDRPGAR